jgi:ricin-type beta-trefoil lectin protein
MSYKARHAALGFGARTAAAVVGAAVAATGAGVIGTGAPASAASTPLSVTLSASSDGASATWNAEGNPVLTLGADSSSTYAQVAVNLNASTGDTAPSTPPSFSTDNYSAGSPRWVIELANGNWITGYPKQFGAGATADFTGNNWAAGNQGTYTTYQQALAAANDALGNVEVTSAYIVADGDQAAGAHDTLTQVQYAGETVHSVVSDGPGTVQNFNSKRCLDVTGGKFADGTALQQWTCGANSPAGVAGGDQQFEILTEADGAHYLAGVNAGAPYFVTSNGQGKALTLSTSPVSALVKSGPYYEFGSLVMDVKGASTANGGTVDAWPLNDGTNQQWSLP